MTINLLDPSEVKDLLKQLSKALDRYERAAEWLEFNHADIYEQWLEEYSK